MHLKSINMVNIVEFPWQLLSSHGNCWVFMATVEFPWQLLRSHGNPKELLPLPSVTWVSLGCCCWDRREWCLCRPRRCGRFCLGRWSPTMTVSARRWSETRHNNLHIAGFVVLVFNYCLYILKTFYKTLNFLHLKPLL